MIRLSTYLRQFKYVPAIANEAALRRLAETDGG